MAEVGVAQIAIAQQSVRKVYTDQIEFLKVSIPEVGIYWEIKPLFFAVVVPFICSFAEHVQMLTVRHKISDATQNSVRQPDAKCSAGVWNALIVSLHVPDCLESSGRVCLFGGRL